MLHQHGIRPRFFLRCLVGARAGLSLRRGYRCSYGYHRGRSSTGGRPRQGVALILDIDLKLRERPSVAGEVLIL